jgi:hypothetical protein
VSSPGSQRQKRHGELDRRSQPQAVAQPRAIAAERKGEERDGCGEQRRLPQVVEQAAVMASL